MSDPVARKAYYSIGEVCELTGLKPHVLRYWETQFGALNPTKNRSGNRVYQRKQIRLILLIKYLLYEEKYTIDGARRKLEKLRRGEGLEETVERILEPELLAAMKHDLAELLELLSPDAPDVDARSQAP